MIYFGDWARLMLACRPPKVIRWRQSGMRHVRTAGTQLLGLQPLIEIVWGSDQLEDSLEF